MRQNLKNKVINALAEKTEEEEMKVEIEVIQIPIEVLSKLKFSERP